MAERVYPRTYSVEQILFYIKEYLGEDSFLSSLAVSGEVSGFRAHSSGHVYFSLREGEHQLRVVLFRRYAALQQWLPRDGDRVIVIGSASLYERDGSVQLYAQALLPAGQGAEQQAQNELKQRLEEEGLFSPEGKQPLPAFAGKVGVVTAADSAAWADLQRILYGRLPGVEIRLYPALVQGDQAAESLAAAIAKADRGGHDVLIVGRGGGAEEDLAAFNTETVVRAIAAASTPLISAVGHESDVTLADLAADVRAATPTHAATLAVPDAALLLQRLESLAQRLSQAGQRVLQLAESRFLRLAASPCWEPASLFSAAQSRLLSLESRLEAAGAGLLESRAATLDALSLRLELLSPLATLGRGYSLALDADGHLLRDAACCRAGDLFSLRLAKGSLWAEIRSVDPEK
ncbi:MAG: exodeoxyribonuclease VII large subunit [Firmicutes bacterium]|nr:exodeoxyribonuclease VII large subunit [Bacillota bacterium]